MNTCDNCGASYDEGLDKCPYCGAIEPVNAEKKYMEKLQKVRKNLDNVDEMAAEDFFAEVKKFLKAFLITAAVATVIGVLIYVGSKNIGKHNDIMERAAVDDTMTEVVAYRDCMMQWNELFKAEKYDEFCNAITEERYSFSNIYGYEHFDFYTAYKAMQEVEQCLDNQELPYDNYEIYSLLLEYAEAEREYDRFITEEENQIGAKVLREKKGNLINAICELPEFDESVLSEFIATVYDGKYITSSAVRKFVEERWGQI